MICRATGKAINVDELDITFDPNIESTRVGLKDFEDEEIEKSPKKSSRKKSTSRIKGHARSLSQEDRGSYLNFDGQDDQENLQTSKRLSQELMPPPGMYLFFPI